MSQSVLRWRQGEGWLVLIGSGNLDEGDFDGIYSDIISQADMFQPMIYLPTAGGTSEQATRDTEVVLETWQDMGGVPGVILPVWGPEDASSPKHAAKLREADVIILGDGEHVALLAQVLGNTVLGLALADAYAAGAIVVGQGAGAMVLGQWVAQLGGQGYQVRPGLGWIQAAIVEPEFASLAESARLQYLLRKTPDHFGIGIPNRTALVLTPSGDFYTWGTGDQITITLHSDD